MQNLLENWEVYAAAAGGVLAGLWLVLKALKPLIKNPRYHEIVDEVGEALDEANIIDTDGDGK